MKFIQKWWGVIVLILLFLWTLPERIPIHLDRVIEPISKELIQTCRIEIERWKGSGQISDVIWLSEDTFQDVVDMLCEEKYVKVRDQISYRWSSGEDYYYIVEMSWWSSDHKRYSITFSKEGYLIIDIDGTKKRYRLDEEYRAEEVMKPIYNYIYEYGMDDI